MNQDSKICLIGEVIVDVSLVSAEQDKKMRLGGIIHAARTLWAMGIEYDLLYISPDYLSEQIEEYAQRHGASSTIKIGTVIGAPNIILMSEPTEAGDQGYELLSKQQSNF